jgi:hypothetical protein
MTNVTIIMRDYSNLSYDVVSKVCSVIGFINSTNPTDKKLIEFRDRLMNIDIKEDEAMMIMQSVFTNFEEVAGVFLDYGFKLMNVASQFEVKYPHLPDYMQQFANLSVLGTMINMGKLRLEGIEFKYESEYQFEEYQKLGDLLSDHSINMEELMDGVKDIMGGQLKEKLDLVISTMIV